MSAETTKRSRCGGDESSSSRSWLGLLILCQIPASRASMATRQPPSLRLSSLQVIGGEPPVRRIARPVWQCTRTDLRRSSFIALATAPIGRRGKRYTSLRFRRILPAQGAPETRPTSARLAFALLSEGAATAILIYADFSPCNSLVQYFPRPL